jgi:hypothetical protein
VRLIQLYFFPKATLEDQVLKKWRTTIGQLVWTQRVSGQDYIDAQKKLRKKNKLKQSEYKKK